jgi:surface antigen
MLSMQMSVTRFLPAGLLAALAVAVPAAASTAPGTVQLFAPRTVRAGASTSVALRLAGARTRCQLRLSDARKAPSTTRWSTATRTRLTWAWRVPANARTATWTVWAACARVVAQSATVRVIGTAHGPLSLAGHVTVTATGAPLRSTPTPGPNPGASAPVNETAPSVTGTASLGQTLSASPGTWTPAGSTYSYQWQQSTTNGFADISGADGQTYEPVFADVGQTLRVSVTASDTAGESTATGSPTVAVGAGDALNTPIMCNGYDGPQYPDGTCEFPAGQCTYWAYEMRPDIVNSDPYGPDWAAGYWAQNAVAEGYSVGFQDPNTGDFSSPPRAGDIAVIARGPGFIYGEHVAYVQSVSTDQYGNTWVTVTEMNFNGDPNVQTEVTVDTTFDAYIHQR